MIQEKLKGTGVALVTPFTKDLAVDYNGLAKLLDFVLDGGVDYIVINGTTAESVTTTADEKKQLLQTIKQALPNAKVEVVGDVRRRMEIVESLPIILPLLQNRGPTQPRLRPVEDQKFEQPPVIVQRHAPFLIVILHVKGIVSAPSTPYFF